MLIVRKGTFIYFAMMSGDLGFMLDVWVLNKHFAFKMPIPIEWQTIRYSVRHQGWWKSFKNGFYAPLQPR